MNKFRILFTVFVASVLPVLTISAYYNDAVNSKVDLANQTTFIWVELEKEEIDEPVKFLEEVEIEFPILILWNIQIQKPLDLFSY